MKKGRRRLDSKPESSPHFEVTWTIGIPQSGKTTLAVSRAVQRAAHRGVALVAIDSARVAQLAGLHEIKSRHEALQAVSEKLLVRYVPREQTDCEGMLEALRRRGDCVVLVDEAHYWLSARSGSQEVLVHLMREAQHSRLDLFLTTQHLTGDVPQAALSCTSRLLVLRCTAPRVLDLLERTWDLDRQTVQALPQFHYLEQRIGFE